MILGRVTGEVWASRKHGGLDGQKLLIVKPHAWYAPTHDVGHLIAVDSLGAGIGEEVVVCLGAPARWSLGGKTFPVEAAIAAIVDHTEIKK